MVLRLVRPVLRLPLVEASTSEKLKCVNELSVTRDLHISQQEDEAAGGKRHARLHSPHYANYGQCPNNM